LSCTGDGLPGGTCRRRCRADRASCESSLDDSQLEPSRRCTRRFSKASCALSSNLNRRIGRVQWSELLSRRRHRANRRTTNRWGFRPAQSCGTSSEPQPDHIRVDPPDAPDAADQLGRPLPPEENCPCFASSTANRIRRPPSALWPTCSRVRYALEAAARSMTRVIVGAGPWH